MPTKVEKDAITGTETTGHVWDGIKELNTPLPKWWLYVFYATVIYSLVYWVLFPSIPGFSGYLSGVLGYNSRVQLEEKLENARAEQAGLLKRIADEEVTEIPDDTELFNFAFAGGRSAFADNCAPCHGAGGAGQRGFPSLADDSWLWGGTLDDIHTTLLYGIRADNDETHYSEMPAFGTDEILEPADIEKVAGYVLSLSGGEGAMASDDGAALYAENCAACHGDNGEGDQEQGAPRLNDQIWLYGGKKADIIAQVRSPRHGVMPAWDGRLDPATIKLLTVYVHALGGGQ